MSTNTIVRDETTDMMYCGTDIGVYRYDLNNASAGWECFNMGMPPCIIMDLEINYCENRIYAATHGRGVYSTAINEFTGICDCENNMTDNMAYNAGDVEYFEVADWIKSTANVNSGANVTYDAGKYVCLNPGFLADNNAVFLAQIDGCESNSNDLIEKEESGRSENAEQVVVKNYPNPFTGHTTIEFTLQSDSAVTLFVSDVTGRQIVALLNNEQQTEGTHQVTFDGNPYPAGMYYYTIQAGEYAGTQKMILVK